MDRDEWWPEVCDLYYYGCDRCASQDVKVSGLSIKYRVCWGVFVLYSEAVEIENLINAFAQQSPANAGGREEGDAESDAAECGGDSHGVAPC